MRSLYCYFSSDPPDICNFMEWNLEMERYYKGQFATIIMFCCDFFNELISVFKNMGNCLTNNVCTILVKMRRSKKNGHGCNFSVKLRHYLFHNCSEELSWKSEWDYSLSDLIICTIDYIMTGNKYMLICGKDKINICLLFEIMNFSPQVTEQKFSKSLRRAYWAKNI